LCIVKAKDRALNITLLCIVKAKDRALQIREGTVVGGFCPGR
jgi:hypothetical protein